MPDPATSVTPADKNIKPKKLRLIRGSSFTYSLVMSVPSVALSVSSSGCVAVTSIVAKVPATSSLKFSDDS